MEIGERRKRYGVRAHVHVAAAVANSERRTAASGNHQVIVAGKNDSEGEGTSSRLVPRAPPAPACNPAAAPQ